VQLGRLAGWSPLPLSVRDARRVAGPLRDRLAPMSRPMSRPVSRAAGAPVARTEKLVAAYGDLVALDRVSLEFRRSEIVALMGRNGAGKTTLLAHLVGLRRPAGGTVDVGGAPPYGRPGRLLAKSVGLVPQDPGRLLYGETVAEECATADREGGLPDGTTAAALRRIAPEVDPDRHPYDLSEGERLSVALALVLAAAPPLILLDEPTRGLDYASKDRLVAALSGLAAGGHCVVLSTHDVELAAALTTRTVVLADGEVVADGPTRDVVRQSPAFAPQVAKVLGGEWLTVADVAAAMAVPS
jgi:energy-coupling factor transport system ATP-binding protein